MGLITETLTNLLGRQVEVHGTVVWYDPEGAYLKVAGSLKPEDVAGAAIQRYDPQRGFVWLRQQLEPLWEKCTAPPRMLIYVPLAQAETGHALVEFEVAGAVVQPGQQPPERNTALDAVAHRALELVFPPAAVEEIVGQVEAGQLSLAELDDLVEKRVEAQTGVVVTLFGTGNAAEVALCFLAGPALDAEIEARQALGNLAGLLSDALGVRFPADQGAVALRAHLARQVLVTDLLEALGDKAPQALRTVPLAARPLARQAAVDLARAWRNRRDAAESYVQWAERVQTEIGLTSLSLDLDLLSRSETFAAGEVQLQREVETALASRPAARLVELAQARLGGFWAAQKPLIKARWEVIADAGRVLVEAARVAHALNGKTWSASALVSGYALGDNPWCALDTAQRHLERDFHRFELDVQQHESLIQLVAQARQHYATVSDHLAECFTRAYATDHFDLPGILLQADVYREAVAPAARSGHVAYILVDALRFEMARELCAILCQEWEAELAPALATPPTVTEIGMAALLPGAEQGLAVAPAEGGKLAAMIGDRVLRTRQERLAYCEEVVKDSLVIAKLDQLAPLSDTHLGQSLKLASVVVVTATEEIDGLCENNPVLARRSLDDVLNQLRRGIKALFGLGIQTVIVSADHGYLFGEKLMPGQSLDAPGGQTATLKRRVWVGRGGAESPGLLRAPLSAFGLGGDLELATPWNLSCLKVKGGATEYFHGGLSLPELVVPVLTVRPAAGRGPTAVAQVQWTLIPGSQTISTRFFSVTVEGRSAELLPLEPPAVRVEVRAGDLPISAPITAGYGFQEATRDVQLALEADDPRAIARNTITLMITETPPVDQVTVHLLDATTGVSMARLDHVPFSITL